MLLNSSKNSARCCAIIKICGLCLRDFQSEFIRCHKVKEQVQVTKKERAEMEEDEDYN